MARTVGIGNQDFEKIVTRDIFYIDKTGFIREWWANEDEVTAAQSIHKISGFLHRYYGKKVIILLDEYDTPMQESYVNGSLYEKEHRKSKKPLNSFSPEAASPQRLTNRLSIIN